MSKIDSNVVSWFADAAGLTGRAIDSYAVLMLLFISIYAANADGLSVFTLFLIPVVLGIGCQLASSIDSGSDPYKSFASIKPYTWLKLIGIGFLPFTAFMAGSAVIGFDHRVLFSLADSSSLFKTMNIDLLIWTTLFCYCWFMIPHVVLNNSSILNATSYSIRTIIKNPSILLFQIALLLFLLATQALSVVTVPVIVIISSMMYTSYRDTSNSSIY